MAPSFKAILEKHLTYRQFACFDVLDNQITAALNGFSARMWYVKIQ